MAQRFGSKIALIKEAMDSQPDNTYAIITEIDVRFFGNASAQIADLVDDALERCGPNCDAVFQWRMTIPCIGTWGLLSYEFVVRAAPLRGGRPSDGGSERYAGGVFRGPNVPSVRGITPATDQQIVNVALWEPERLLSYDDELVKRSRPCLKTALMPSQEVATRGYLLQVSLRYKNKFGMSLYHVNDCGGIPHRTRRGPPKCPSYYWSKGACSSRNSRPCGNWTSFEVGGKGSWPRRGIGKLPVAGEVGDVGPSTRAMRGVVRRLT